MRHIQQFALIAATLSWRRARHAGDAGRPLLPAITLPRADPGFMPDTGQINRGFDEKVPTMSQPRPIPTPARSPRGEAMPDRDQPALGRSANECHHRLRFAGAQRRRADRCDRANHAGQILSSVTTRSTACRSWRCRLSLSDNDRQRIYQAAMADKTAAAEDAEQLAPASELNANQALNETHPLPASVRGISGVQQLGYVKTKDKVFLVEPATRIVVDEIDRRELAAVAENRSGDGDSIELHDQLAVRRPLLIGASFHCLRLSPMTFIAVIDAWLRLA